MPEQFQNAHTFRECLHKESWKLVASQWLVKCGDTSTHSAAGWLLRHWKIPLPEIPQPHGSTPQRDWFVNSVGSTMLRIRPELSAPATVNLDPLEKYRQRLAALETAAVVELDKPEVRMERAVAHFQTGNMDRALEDLTLLMEHEPGKALSTVLMYRTLTLARMGRADDAKQSLARYLEQEVPESYRSYMEILVPAWLGDIPEALRKLETASSDASADQNMMYNLSCAASRCAQATSWKYADQSQEFTNRAIELLEGAVMRGYKNVKEASEDPDFANLQGDARFASILANMEVTVHSEFWVGDREVTRGLFEQLMNDAKYAATEKPADWEGVDTTVSPTADHPAQNVSWYDAVMYCNWLSQREGLMPCYERTGSTTKVGRKEIEYAAWRLIPGATGYRLLNWEECEYACRAGTSTEYSSGNDKSLLLDYCQMFPSKLTATCGEKLPNAWGLHDVHGNVREWCWDSPDASLTGSRTRVIGHGGWFDEAESCRSASYGGMHPTDRDFYCGFRLALSRFQ